MSHAAHDHAALAVASTVHALGETLPATDPALAATIASATTDPKDGAVDTPPRYRTVAPLGEGGMGRVDHVYDADLMRHLALKQLRPEVRGDRRLVRQFLWEARITAHLDHPNIVPLHELGVDGAGRPYFTMKKVEGTPLDVVLERLQAGDEAWCARLPLPRRLRLFVEICDAIAFAHERGVLHRDLKPANVMIAGHREVLVMDWGIAATLATEEGERLAAMIPDGVPEHGSSGTPLYMSPEQARGEALDGRSDVYTLGAMLYELIALARPYDGDSVSEILSRVRRADAVPIQEIAPGAPSSVIAVIERAMAADPAERYESVAALREDVETVIDGRTPKAEDASIATRVGRFYAAQNPGLANLRVVHFELAMMSAGLTGAAIGAWVAAWIGAWWWSLLPLAALLFAPTGIAWWRGATRAR